MVGDTNADGFDDLLVGSPGTNQAYLFAGPLTGGLEVTDATATIPVSVMASSLTGAGDVDGDGHADFAVASTRQKGTVYVVHGPVSGTVSPADGLVFPGDDDTWFTGEVYDAAGDTAYDLMGSGDWDGDGDPDLAVITEDIDGGSRVTVFDPMSQTLAEPAFEIGPHSGVEPKTGTQGRAFHFASLGDIDADGVEDYGVGAPLAYDGTNIAGGAFVFRYTPTGGTAIDLDYPDSTLWGSDWGSRAGDALAGAGDLNGDGYDDVLVGATGVGGTFVWETTGAVYVVYGPASGSGDLATVSDASVIPASTGGYCGSTVDGAGDFNDDGDLDITFGCRYLGGGGSLFVMAGPLSGTMTAETDAWLQVTNEGEAAAMGGGSLVGGWDADGDGVPDVTWGRVRTAPTPRTGVLSTRCSARVSELAT